MLLLISQTAQAQFNPDTSSTNTSSKDTSRSPGNDYFFGGSVGLSFTSNSAFIAAEPVVGKHITKRLDVAVGLKYNYFRQDIPLINGDEITFSTSVYGTRTFAQYNIWRFLSAHTEVEYLNTDLPSTVEDADGRHWITNVWIGGGIFQPFAGGQSGFYMMYLYNLTDPLYSPFPNPRILVGFTL